MSDSTQGPSMVPRSAKPQHPSSLVDVPTVLHIPDFREPTPKPLASPSLPEAADLPNKAAVQTALLPTKRPRKKAQLIATGIIAALVAWVMFVFSGGDTPPTDESSIPPLAEVPKMVPSDMGAVAAELEQETAATTEREFDSIDEELGDSWATLDSHRPEPTQNHIQAASGPSHEEAASFKADNQQLASEPVPSKPADEPYVDDPSNDDSYVTDYSPQSTDDNGVYQAESRGPGSAPDADAITADDSTGYGTKSASQFEFGPTLQSPNGQGPNGQSQFEGSAYENPRAGSYQPQYQARQPQAPQRQQPTTTVGSARDARRRFPNRPDTVATGNPPPQTDNTGYPTTDPATYWYPPNQLETVPRTAGRPARSSSRTRQQSTQRR